MPQLMKLFNTAGSAIFCSGSVWTISFEYKGYVDPCSVPVTKYRYVSEQLL